MFNFVDKDEDHVLEGFAYTNRDDDVEYVRLNTDMFKMCIPAFITIDASEETIDIYVEDIPKLIKALDSAHKHLKGLN